MNRIYLFITVMFINSAIIAQGFIQVDANKNELDKQFNSILSNANEDIFIGYSITTNTDHLMSIGSFFFDGNNHKFSLRDIISNPAKYNEYFTKNNKQSIKKQHDHKFRIFMHSSRNKVQPDSETAIIFHYSKGENSSLNFNEVTICNLALNIELLSDQLYWLGNVEENVSVNYLLNVYESTTKNRKKEVIISAIGMHKGEPQVTQFLIGIATDKSNNKLREESFYWLGYQDNLDAFNTLKSIVHSNDSKDIKEEAIMGLAQMSSEEAFNELVNIAKRSNETKLRKEAIMWLGEKAVKNAKDELKGFIENDPEIEIKKHALFALSEQSEDNLPYIMELAKSHQSLTIRKNAIYILGECDDKQAVDLLIELATEN